MNQNEYGRLHKVLVGREFDFPQSVWDISFKAFFQDHLDDLDLVKKFSKEYTAKIVAERNEDLDNLDKLLTERGIKVYRPEKIKKAMPIQTPYFKSYCRAAANVRDLCFIYKDTIIETAPSLRGRYFENFSFHYVLEELFRAGMNWIQCPLPKLSDSSIDEEDWRAPRDFSDNRSEMFFDAANLLKVNDKILFNYSSYNHQQGIKWLRHNTDAEIVPVQLVDNHLDGALAFLNEDTVLINNKSCRIDPVSAIPWLKDFKILRLPKNVEMENDENMPHIASREGMSINVLSIDEKTVVVNESDYLVAELLDRNGFNVLTTRLRYSTAFGGGIHCSTLDLLRD